MSKYDDLKKDIDQLYRLQREAESKCQDKMQKINTDITRIDSHFEAVLKTLDSFVKKFEEHDKEEMKKYNSIEDELKKLSSVKTDVDELKESQKRFNKIFWIGSGVFLSVSFVGGLVMFVLDLISKIPK